MSGQAWWEDVLREIAVFEARARESDRRHEESRAAGSECHCGWCVDLIRTRMREEEAREPFFLPLDPDVLIRGACTRAPNPSIEGHG